MAETPEQTFSDEKVPPKEPESTLSLAERAEKILGYKPGTFESRKNIEEKQAREQARATGSANLPKVEDSLKTLVTIYGDKLNVKTPEAMGNYLKEEALKEGPLPRILNTPEASNFFSTVARTEFGYEPRSNTPIYNLDAYREGFKRNKKEQDEAVGLMEQAYQSEAPPDINYVTSYGGQTLEAPRFVEENKAQQQVFNNLNKELSGGALGNLFGLSLTPQQVQLQQRAAKVSPASLSAMGLSDHAAKLDEIRNLTISSDVSFDKQPYRTNQVYVHTVDVGNGSKNAINMRAFLNDFAVAYNDIAAQEAGFKNFADLSSSDKFTKEDVEAITAKSVEKALADIKQIQQQSRPGTIFIDDPDKLVRAVRKGEDPLAYTSIPVNIASGLKNIGAISEETYDAFLRQRGPWAAIWYPPSMRQFNMGTLTYAEQVEDINPGTFQQIMNIGPLRVLGSWLLSDDKEMTYGSSDHLRNLLQFDWGQNLGEVGKKAAELTGAKGTRFEKLTEATGTALGTGVMFIEPDVITLALLPVGYAGKAAKFGAKTAAKTATGAGSVADAAVVYRLKRYENLLDEAVKKIEDGTFTKSTEVMDFFRKNNASEISSMYDLELMGELAQSIRAGTKGKREYSPRFDSLTSKLSETRDNIKDLTQAVSDETAQYIDAYGKVPPGADASAVALLRKRQEEAVLESGSAYAAFVGEREKLARAAEQRGVQLSQLKKQDSTGADFTDQELVTLVEKSKEAAENLGKLQNEFLGKKYYYDALKSFKKLTKKQASDARELEKSLPKLRKQIRDAQELVRDRWADSALKAQYTKYARAKEHFEAKVVETSRLFDDLPLQKDATTGAKFNPATRVREAWAEWSTLKKDVTRHRRNLNRATKPKTQQKHLKAIAEKSEELKQLHNELLRSVEVYTQAAAKGTPGLADIGTNLYKKLDNEIKLGIIENKSAYMLNAVNRIKSSVGAYQDAIKTNRLTTQSPLVQESKFSKLDPNDPSRVIFDRTKYVDELLNRYTVDLDPAIHGAVKKTILDSPAIRTLNDLKPNPNGSITLGAEELRKLADFENTYATQRINEAGAVTSVAQGLIRAWARPPIIDKVFRGMDVTDPKTWLDTALRAGFRTARGYRRMFDPMAHRFGDFNEGALTSAQVAITRQGRANEELTLLSDQWIREGKGYISNVTKYLTTDEAFFVQFRGQKKMTDEGLGVGVPALMNQGEFTPWKKFKSYILELDRPAEALALKAVAYAYVPRGAKLEDTAFSAQVLDKTIQWIKDLDDQSDILDDAAQLKELSRRIKRYTSDQIGIDVDANRTFAFIAKGILHGAVTNDFLTDLARAGGISMSTKEALAANTILGQVKVVTEFNPKTGKQEALVDSLSPGGKTGFSPAEGFKALEQYGLSMEDLEFQTIYRNLNRMENLTTKLIATNKLGGGSKASFVPQSLITQIQEAAGPIAKDLGSIKAPDSMVRKALNLTGTYLRAWRTNILFGSVVPRASFFTNQGFGDLSQLHTFEGAVSIREAQLGRYKGKKYATGALPLMFQNAFTYVPYWGNWVQDFLIERTKDATKSGRRNVLTTPLQAAFNPYLTSLMRMSDELVETKEGFRSTRQFMEEALDDGVFDTLMTDDLYKMLDDANKAHQGTIMDKVDRVLTGVSNFSSNWTNMITTIQARQRLAVYADYRLMRGEARSASKLAVMDSLYDWRHGVTDWEMATLGQFVAFYSFFRLGAKQFQRALLEGLTNPSLDLAKRAMVGRSKLARMRNQGRMVYSVANYVFNEDVDQAMNEAEMQHEIYRRLRPWWIGSRPAPSNQLMPEIDQVQFRRAGRDETYYTTVYPMWTALDMADLHLKLFNGTVGSMLYYGNKGQVRPSFDAGKTINKTLNDFSHPLFKRVTEATTGFIFDEPSAYRSPKGKRLRLGENGAYLAYSKVPFLGSLINITPDKKGYYVDNTTVAMIRGIPILGTDIPNLWRDIGPVSMGGGNPKWASESTEAMKFMLRNWSGIGKQIPFAPGQALDYNRKQVAADLKTKRKQLMERAASEGGPDTSRESEAILYDEK